MKNHLKYLHFLIVLCILFCFNISIAQDTVASTKNNSFALSLGYEKSYFKDINYSQLNQQGNGAVLQFQFQKKLKSNALFSTALDLPFAITKPKAADHFKAAQTIANIEIAYLKNVPFESEKFQLYLGGQYHTYYHLVFYNGTESFTMFGTNGIDVSTFLNYTISSKQNISTKISLPIVAQLVRPPYTGWDKFITDNYQNIPKILTRGKIASINKYFGVNFDLNYEYQYKAKKSILVNYGLRYYTTPEVKKSIVLNNQLNVGLIFKL